MTDATTGADQPLPLTGLPSPQGTNLPLVGLRVVEFTHMVMGPTCGVVLADMGADVIKVEPLEGDRTRHLLGAGAGFFPMFNRNKQSIAIDLQTPEGAEVARRLAASADVVAENFKPGTMKKYGLDYASLSAANERLIYVSHKGFLPGPYEHRTALDEVVQMMGGLAYMTGRPGDPLRAGASVIDVTGGMFGVVAILAALNERHSTGRGQMVQSALFETTVYLIGQHMAQKAVTGRAADPMPARISAWAIYDVFETRDDPIFIGVVTDALWEKFCKLFGLDDLWADESIRANNARVQARDRILPRIRELIAGFTRAELIERLEGSGLPFAPIARPQDMFDDPHLNASGGLEPVTLADGTQTALPALPIMMGGRRPGTPSILPEPGADTRGVLASLGYSDDRIEALFAGGAVG